MRSLRATHFAFVSFVLLLFQVDCYPNKPASISDTVANKNTFINQLKETDPDREYKARVEEVRNPEDDCDDKKADYSKRPEEKEYEVLTPATKKVSYAGSQLWKVNLTDSRNKAIILRLRDRGDVSVWGGNVTIIDTLVKPASVERVTNIFKNRNIPYDIIIENLQEAIEAENPPPPAEIQELSERKGIKKVANL
ncbi:uncharacterized protein LOC112906495 [Agrilus planipennis]|uniref:Uncharacterized protein LOC112906495 n=1 Tax=Agrilus planipennis TaxID=224129 RepID=A0A7F5RKF1_AGRPL|nr:uncharacterized protein LOC112906495 [Agrilus planipennis]